MLLCLITLILSAAHGSDFPPDPNQCTVIDRALFRGSTPGEEHTIYIILYNNHMGEGTIELKTGLMVQNQWYWETSCVWTPENFNDEPVIFEDGSLLSVQQTDNRILITWIDRLTYVEGAATLYLDYNLESREFQEYFLD